MTRERKNQIIDSIMDMLVELTEDTPSDKPVEMLTIKECCEAVNGLTENTVRQLVAQDKVKYVRTGKGKRGKILVNKADLISYFQK